MTRETLLALAMGYLLGSIPFGLILTRIAGKGDIREIGSGNIGATNVLRTGSKLLAALTLVLDCLKATAAVLLAQYLFGDEYGPPAAAGALLGHLYPAWLRFRGGKGVATAIGGFSVLSPLAVLAVVAVFVAVVAATRFVSLGSITAACLLPLAMRLLFHAPDPEVVAASAVTILLIFSHRVNIRHLLEGTERRLGRREP
jgi:glycerol-3-phosphate acyltransferase PlsY